MRELRMAFFATLFSAALSTPASAAEKTVILVRHAEKASETERDPDLSLRGRDRALKLTEFLRGQHIDAIFVTDLVRTQQTAAALANTRKLIPTVLKAGDTKGTAHKIQALPPGAVALVVGHSNTVPEIARALGVTKNVDIDDSEYDRVFVVVLGKDGSAPTLLEFRY